MKVDSPSFLARSKLASLTHDQILRSVANLLSSPNGEVTFRALAKTSGIPERTLYRYFPTREILFDAFWAWLNEHLGMPPDPKSPEELIDYVPALFSCFEAGEPLVRAMLHDSQGRSIRIAHAKARRAKFQAALREVLTSLDPAAREKLLASAHVLCSAAAWETMKDGWGLSSAEAADAARWAVSALIAHARKSSRKGRTHVRGHSGKK